MTQKRFALARPHTLSQFARRAGIAVSYARKLYYDTPSRLPRPNDYDADGAPLWDTAAIDAWCRVTPNRTVPDEAGWLFTAPDATEPAERLFHGVIEHTFVTGGRPYRMHAVHWALPGDEPRHLIYLIPTDDMPNNYGRSVDDQALVAADLLAPRFWADAVVLVDTGLPYRPAEPDKPTQLTFQVYRLTIETGPDSGRPGAAYAPGPGEQQRLRARVDRLLGRTAETPAPPAPPRPQALFAGNAEASEVARVLGTDVVTWLRGTCLPEAIGKARAYTATFTVPDTASAWEETLRPLRAAHRTGLGGAHPAAFALLAADASETLAEVRQTHLRLPERGPGWYLAARPEPPTLPLDLEMELAALPRPSELSSEQILTDLKRLRMTEPELTTGEGDADAEGDALERAMQLLTAAAEPLDARLAVDSVIIDLGRMLDGQVTERWRATLAPHPDPEHMWRTRRGRRLLGFHKPNEVQQLLVDPAGRLVALLPSTTGHGQDYRAEWPVGLPTGWAADTVISGDHGEGNSCGPLFALTRTPEGWHADPVPAPPAEYNFNGFIWGYPGTGPGVLYDLLLRVALGSPHGLGPDFDPPDDSELWQTIASTRGPLRIPWPTLCRWAAHDAEHGTLRE